MYGIGSQSARSPKSDTDGTRLNAFRWLGRGRKSSCRWDSAALGCALVLALPLLSGCVDLFPDLEWEASGPFGGVGLGVDDSAPGVVNSLDVPDTDQSAGDALGNPNTKDLSGHGVRAQDEPVLDEALRGAIARATGEAGPSLAVDVGLVEADTPLIRAETSADPKNGIEADPTLPLDPSEGDSAGLPAGGIPVGDHKLGVAEAPIGPDPRVNSTTTKLEGAQVLAPEPAPALDAVAAADVDSDDRAQATTGALERTLSLPADEPLSAPPTHTSTTFTDLGFWFGRPVVTSDSELLGKIGDIRMDFHTGRVAEVVVYFRRRAAFGVPMIAIVPVKDLRDGFPHVEIFILEPAPPAVKVVATSYDDLVRLAFEREVPVIVKGKVISVDESKLDTGPAMAVVKLRDAENLLHRLDLGEMNLIEGSGELPLADAEFAVMAVKSRDERGPIWHVASILTEGEPIEIRNAEGVALRHSAPIEPREPVLWSARAMMGRSVQCWTDATGSSVPAPDTVDSEIAVLAGLLMARDTNQVAFGILRPRVDGDRGNSYWLVPIQNLLFSEDGVGPLGIGIEEERQGLIPRLSEDRLSELDAPGRLEAINAFWD